MTPCSPSRVPHLPRALSVTSKPEESQCRISYPRTPWTCGRPGPTKHTTSLPGWPRHCLGLLGYAARAEASILVWVARSFSSYHRSILEWLNDADTIHVYAVAVQAYRVGDVLTADFETVVAPRQSQPTASRPTKSTTENTNTLYADFYRPLVKRLRREGINPVGKGGWRGRWRSFQTGHDSAVYATGLDEGKAMVFLSFRGTAHQERSGALREHREDIAGKVEGTLLWENHPHESNVILKRAEDFDLTAPEADMEAVR